MVVEGVLVMVVVVVVVLVVKVLEMGVFVYFPFRFFSGLKLFIPYLFIVQLTSLGWNFLLSPFIVLCFIKIKREGIYLLGV